jgi:DnaK suppressor protein
MDEGTYGQCEECSAPIALARLLARPTADLCIQCKEVEELREKQQMVSMIS